MSERTFEIVRQALVDHLNLNPDDIKPESLITDDLGADSLDAVELIIALEEQLNISIDEADNDALRTVGDIVKLIDSINHR